MLRLYEIAYSDGFVDKETWGLKGNLYYAISNLIQKDRYIVLKMLNILISNSAGNDKLIFQCNYLQSRIDADELRMTICLGKLTGLLNILKAREVKDKREDNNEIQCRGNLLR